jgi:single stranded DNA-binding protein
MLAVNTVIVGGKLVKEVESFRTAKGTEVGTMVLEVEETYRDKEGNEQQKTTLVEVKFFGKAVENYKRKFRRGAQVLCEGELAAYVNKEGKVFNSVVCRHAHFVGPPNKAAGERDQSPEESPVEAPIPESTQEMF